MRIILFALLLTLSTVAGRRGTSGGGGFSSRYGGGSSHTYPHSTGYSGTGTGRGYSYPHSNGLSGTSHGSNTNNYNNHQNTARRTSYTSKTEVHHHYHYSPPQQISYGSVYHPVYHGTPPIYVYEYRNSGSRFDSLLTGLALYNLGRMSANNHHYSHSSYGEYHRTAGEICKLGISKTTGEYEETRIDCKLMSSFIYDMGTLGTSQNEQHAVSSNSITTTVTNMTQSAIGNGTLMTSVTVKNETVTDALNVKGPSIPVTPGMTCYMIRTIRYSATMRRNVECGLLQEYSRSSLYSSANSEHLKPMLAILVFLIFCYRVIFLN